MFRDIANETLAKRGYRGAAALREPLRLREALRREIGELECRIPWWERIIFFRDTPDEERLEAANRELGAVDAEIAAIVAADEQVYAAAAAEIPQLRIAQHLGAAARKLAHHTELAIDWEYEDLAAILGELAEAVRSSYLPDVDVARALDELAVSLDRPSAAAAARPEPHGVWGGLRSAMRRSSRSRARRSTDGRSARYRAGSRRNAPTSTASRPPSTPRERRGPWPPASSATATR